MRLLLALSISLMLAPVARAAGLVGPPDDSTRVRGKDPMLALGLSLVNTAVPVSLAWYRLKYVDSEMDRRSGGLLLYGLVLGPTAGHLYAGNGGRAVSGAMGRLGTIGLTVAGTGVAIIAAFGNDDVAAAAGVLGMVAGGGFTVYSACRDIWEAPDSAIAYNERHGFAVSARPLLNPIHRQVGLALRLWW